MQTFWALEEKVVKNKITSNLNASFYRPWTFCKEYAMLQTASKSIGEEQVYIHLCQLAWNFYQPLAKALCTAEGG